MPSETSFLSSLPLTLNERAKLASPFAEGFLLPWWCFWVKSRGLIPTQKKPVWRHSEASLLSSQNLALQILMSFKSISRSNQFPHWLPTHYLRALGEFYLFLKLPLSWWVLSPQEQIEKCSPWAFTTTSHIHEHLYLSSFLLFKIWILILPVLRNH